MVSADGLSVICPRVVSAHKVGEAGYLHRLGDSADLPSAQYYTPSTKPKSNDFPLATVARRDFTYQTLLDELGLSPMHYANLVQRGLTDEAITHHEYKSLPGGSHLELASKIATQGKVAGVPGFYRDTEGIKLSGATGLLIPIRSLDCLTVGCQIRRDAYDGTGAKYVWLSSSGFRYGSSPGTPTHVSFPLEFITTTYCYVTEGPLKADIVSFYTGAVCLGIPGVTAWGKALSILADLLPLNVVLAFDSDRFENPAVERAYESFKTKLLQNKFNLFVAIWPREYKGIDDWLCATQGKEIVRLQTIHQATLERKLPNYKESLAKSYKNESPSWQSINKLKTQATHIVGPDRCSPFAIPGCDCTYCVAVQHWFDLKRVELTAIVEQPEVKTKPVEPRYGIKIKPERSVSYTMLAVSNTELLEKYGHLVYHPVNKGNALIPNQAITIRDRWHELTEPWSVQSSPELGKLISLMRKAYQRDTEATSV